MKKLYSICSLLLMEGLFAYPVYAAHITHNDYISDTTITASGQNTNENTIVNEINGNLDGTNLTAGAVDTTNLTSTVQASFVPTGSVFMYTTTLAPLGYLLCNGQAVSRTTYAALFNVISTFYGVGDNSTTFNVPNLVDRMVLGTGNLYSLGATGGATTDAQTTSSNGAHTHDLVNNGDAGSTNYPSGTGVVYAHNNAGSSLEIVGAGGTTASIATGRTDSQGAHTHTVTTNILNPYMGLPYIIKY